MTTAVAQANRAANSRCFITGNNNLKWARENKRKDKRTATLIGRRQRGFGRTEGVEKSYPSDKEPSYRFRV